MPAGQKPFIRQCIINVHAGKISVLCSIEAMINYIKPLPVCQLKKILYALRWLEIVFEIFSTRKRFTFIYIIAAFNVAT